MQKRKKKTIQFQSILDPGDYNGSIWVPTNVSSPAPPVRLSDVLSSSLLSQVKMVQLTLFSSFHILLSCLIEYPMVSLQIRPHFHSFTHGLSGSPYMESDSVSIALMEHWCKLQWSHSVHILHYCEITYMTLSSSTACSRYSLTPVLQLQQSLGTLAATQGRFFQRLLFESRSISRSLPISGSFFSNEFVFSQVRLFEDSVLVLRIPSSQLSVQNQFSHYNIILFDN